MTHEELLNVPDAAQYLGIRPWTLRQKLPVFDAPGNKWSASLVGAKLSLVRIIES